MGWRKVHIRKALSMVLTGEGQGSLCDFVGCATGPTESVVSASTSEGALGVGVLYICISHPRTARWDDADQGKAANKDVLVKTLPHHLLSVGG